MSVDDNGDSDDSSVLSSPPPSPRPFPPPSSRSVPKVVARARFPDDDEYTNARKSSASSTKPRTKGVVRLTRSASRSSLKSATTSKKGGKKDPILLIKERLAITGGPVTRYGEQASNNHLFANSSLV